MPGNVKVGDVLNIRVPNRNTSSTCDNFIPVAATVKVIGQRGIFLEDNANPTGGFSATDYQSLSDQFDAKIYATDVAYFGTPTDFDNNTRVVIVLTKEVNKIENLLGQVFFADLFADECASSNDGEFFYGRTPDPSGAAGAAYTVADALLDAPIIIAHEFTHLIQIGRRITYPPATAVQSTWELEGQATFSEEVNGYAVTGLAPGQNLGFEIAFNNPADAADQLVRRYVRRPRGVLRVHVGHDTRAGRARTVQLARDALAGEYGPVPNGARAVRCARVVPALAVGSVRRSIRRW